ncbi:MAG: hypothetical protein MJZ35_01205 [Bacteroidaceae bacterium]|nr:hypothetical protein [Bacteroidaceae bacterium]
MKKTNLMKLAAALIAMLTLTPVLAQRIVDKLDRGLIAMKASGTGIYLSWRVLGEEYYDVQYNVYRDGTKVNDEPLSVSCYTDKGGTSTSTYTVRAVVRGVEQPACKGVTPWASSYKEVKLAHEGIASKLIPNDACCADVDGDGELEILMKFDNESEMAQSYPKAGPTIGGKATGEYSIFEIFKQDGQRLWWVNCGPNMGDFQNNEQNIVGYDWNQDGKAEVVMRLLEGSSIHMADGTVYTIGANGKNGSSWTNYRGATGGGVNWFMHDGKEFLVYCNGQTGEVYDIIDYPLARLEPGEASLEKAWGDGYGHRCSKFFFGAPYLDGRHPSIFLARGIYTQIKMCALDVNTATNKLTKRWDWRQTSGGFWMWQGYHNFGVADVDEDGRDEIVYGSMVVDDNGKGLSTTGFGHGDAQHCGDFNPYTKGLEIYACNEDQPGNNYRDATTSKVYHRFNAGNDDGRAMMDNFTDRFPGSIGCSAREGAISSVTYGAVSGMDATGINTNFRIYWDGDLCSETFNYLNGKNTEGCVAKYGSWTPIYTCAGSMTNNDTKGTPCYQGDILGDWREEIIMRTASGNIRIYSTPTPTTYRVPTLWSDHQYRNAMVWQMCGYNQPPHVSYFMGKLEGITVTPPPLTMEGRVEVPNGGLITSEDKHFIVCETNDTKVTMADGATPYIVTFNVPSWVQGTAGTNYTDKDANIKYQYYTCEVQSGSLAGDARLVKQGDGVLKLPKTDFTHVGPTDVWAGVLEFDGTMKQSPLWLNRFAELNTDGGVFGSIKADYASVIRPGGENHKGSLTAESLELGFGSRLVLDLYADDISADQLLLGNLTIEAKTDKVWTTAGPFYLSPVIQLVGHTAQGSKMTAGKYVIGTLSGSVEGSLDNIVLEGLDNVKKKLQLEDGKLILEIFDMRDAASIVWTGAATQWDLGDTESFAVGSGESTVFVSGDDVIFNDDASVRTVNVVGSVIPRTFTVNNSGTAYTFQGAGGIDGDAQFVKEGTGKVVMKNSNTYTGGNTLSGGVTTVTLLSNQFSEVGNLGGITGTGKFVMQNGAELNTTTNVQMGSPITVKTTEGAVLNNASDFVMDAAFSGTRLTKKGNGWLKSGVAGTLQTLIISAGVVDASQRLATKYVAEGTADLRGNAFLNTPIEVAEKAKANLTTVNRATTSLALTGSGQLTVWCATEKGSNYYATRTPIQLNLKNFLGTLVAQATYAADGRFTFDTSNGGDGWTLDIPSDRFVQNTGKTLRIGQITGSGRLGGGCTFSNGASVGANTWQVGNDGNFTFDGIVTSSDKFTKMGSGKMTVKGLWDLTGTVGISAGELCINNTNTKTPALGTGALTVSKGGTLSGKGVLGNSSVTVASGGVIRSGINDTNAGGNLVFSGKDLTVNGTLQTYVSGKSLFSRFTDIKTLKLNGTLVVRGRDVLALPEGTEIQIIDAQKITLGTNLKFDLCAPNVDDPSLIFDTSRIDEGLLVVAKDPNYDPTAIQRIDMAAAKGDIYTLDGKRIEGRPLHRGIYIVNGVKIILK